MTIKFLKNRWIDNDEVESDYNKILNIIKFGGSLSDLDTPFGKTNEGYADFRGIDLSNKKLMKCTFNHIDFSHSNFSSARIEKSVFLDCNFDKVVFVDASENNNTFEDTNFLRCSFNYAFLGYGGSLFNKCMFLKTTFTKTNFIRPEFYNVSFKECKLKNIDFSASYFKDCNFIGKLESVWFRGGYDSNYDQDIFGKSKKNKMENISFENAILKEVNFSNDCDLSTIKLPSKGKYKLYDNWYSRLKNIKNELLNKDIGTLIKFYEIHAKKQKWFLINVDELEQEYDKKSVNQIIKILDSYE